MSGNKVLCNALALCRRVFVGLFVITACMLVALWLFMPNVNKLKPDIELFLKHSLQLQSLELGQLSWFWHDGLVLKAEDFSLQYRHQNTSGLQQRMHIEHATLILDVSIWRMLQGEFVPEKVAVLGGLLETQWALPNQQVGHIGDLDKSVSTMDLTGLPSILSLEHIDVSWSFDTGTQLYQQHWQDVNVDFDYVAKSLSITLPSMNAKLTLDRQGVPQALELNIENLAWLPDNLQQYVQGDVEGGLTIQRHQNTWNVRLNITGEQAALYIPTIDFQVPFQDLVLQGRAQIEKQNLQSFETNILQWKLGQSVINASANWQRGELSLHATSDYLDMPVLWGWLQPLDDSKEWHDWLMSMKKGVASKAKAEVHLPWAEPLHQPPSHSNWDMLRYAVTGHVEDVDIGLGPYLASLSHSNADIMLDENGLHADVSHAELPQDIGAVQGVLYIPWNTLILDVQAEGEVQTGRLQAWLDKEGAEKLHWLDAPAKAKATIRWLPSEDLPRDAVVTLIPNGIWRLKPQQGELKISQGTVVWNIKTGLHAKALKVQSALFQGKVSFRAAPIAQHRKLLDFQGDLQASFKDVVNHYRLPIEKAAGMLSTRLNYQDGLWHGDLDLSQSTWLNLMGNDKPEQAAMHLQYEGRMDKTGYIYISKLSCDDTRFELRGSGKLGQDGMQLNLSKLKTDKFNGRIKVQAPFGKEPWEIDVYASFLDRKALPQKMPKSSNTKKKLWALRADIDKFIWSDASMQGVHIDIASATGSTGILKAEKIHSGTLDLQQVKAMFSLPGEGMIDLRELSATMDGQHLMLSATLSPEAAGGMHWRGFAQISGVFGNIMKRAELTQLFDGGQMQALFSGQGVLLRDEPWWEGLQGRLRLRVDDGVIRKGDTLTKFLAALSLTDLPALLLGQRKDLTADGLFYKRLQIEAILQGRIFDIKNLVFRSSALDVAGQGQMDLETTDLDMIMVARPFQNIDALLSKIPLLRDIIGGAAHSFMRKIYRMHGPVANAKVDSISAKEAGLARGGLVESLLNLPSQWFDSGQENKTPSPTQ